MASIVKTQYGTTNQAITITLASLANSASRESASIDNRTNLFLDALVSLSLKTSATAPGTNPFAYVYAAGTVDDGTSWPDTVTGADAGITLNTVTQLRLLGQIWLGAASTTYKGGPWSVASVFGGVLPALWSIVVFNAYGGALDATEGNHNKRYQGIQAQIV